MPSASSPSAGRAAGQRGRFGTWGLLGLLVSLLPLSVGASTGTLPVAAISARQFSEYEVKAAYLLNFTRYIAWPAKAFAEPSSPIVIGVLGEDPLGPIMARDVHGQTSQGRAVEVRRLTDPAEAQKCHLVFVSRGQERKEAAWFQELKNLPVVTVAESADGLQRGAVLAVYMEDRAGGPRVVFGANLPAAREAGVQLSSAMLQSARRIIRETAVKKESR